MPPKDAPVAVLIDQEKWPTICGEEAEPNFLVVLEPFNKWCGPSEAILSTLARINRDLPHRRIKFMQMEATADIPELEKFTKISRPHFLFFRNGEHLDTVEGINAPQIEKFIGDFIPEGVIETDDVGDEEEDDD